MLVRIIAGALAAGLICAVVRLGLLSAADPAYIAWFGLASAILVPIGLTLFGVALRTKRLEANELIERLARVPELERLLEQARTTEEKVRLLEAERERLVDAVRIEARRLALADRTHSLENDAVRIVAELAALEQERSALGEGAATEGPAREAIRQLHEHVKARQSGDLLIPVGSSTFRVSRVLLEALPLGEIMVPLLDHLRVRRARRVARARIRLGLGGSHVDERRGV